MSASRRRVSPVAVVLAMGAMGLAVGVGGCNLVVGSGDYVVGLGDGGSGPPSNLDGSPTPAVDGVAPGLDASSEPETSTPVDAGATGDGGPASVCTPNGALVPGGLPTGDPAFQKLVSACVLAVSCDPQYFEVTVSDCITNDHLHAYFQSDCLANITSCADYYACQGSRVATPTECAGAVAGGSDTGSCSGGVATSCSSSGYGTVANCTALGGSCVVYDTTDIGDESAGCQISSSCTDDDGFIHCATTSEVYSCEDTTTVTVGILHQTCPQGSTCTMNNGVTGCFTTGPSCSTPGSTCANDALTTCVSVTSGDQQYTNACSAAGLECITSVSGTGSCTAPGCDTSDCVEGCDGSKLQTCIGGAPYEVDCTTLGFDTCTSDPSSGYNYCDY